jgi:transcriptional regulator with XRE-family HTH domain
MSDEVEPDILVQRLHMLAVQRGLTIKEMAQKCGVPKSSLEGYMRLKDAKRPGVDALVSIADAMGVSIDWLVGRVDARQMGEAERRRMALAMFRLTIEILKDIETAQLTTTEPVVTNGMVGNRPISDFAAQVMLHFLSKEKLVEDFALNDGLRIMDELLEEASDPPSKA